MTDLYIKRKGDRIGKNGHRIKQRSQSRAH